MSPDLLPIKLVWDELDHKVRNKLTKSEPELKALYTTWKSLFQDYFHKLLERMPRICSAIMKVHGGFFFFLMKRKYEFIVVEAENFC